MLRQSLMLDTNPGQDSRNRLRRSSHDQANSLTGQPRYHLLMSQPFVAGDNLIFQLESGYGLVRVLAIAGAGPDSIWHLLTYEELFPDVESAEQALATPASLHVSNSHLALTNRAFERTPLARLSHHSVSAGELSAYDSWKESAQPQVFDRSLLQLLGMR